ncbi:MAG: tetratricopeptide repeat protein [Halothermotrichaceae bacterium]
MKAKKFYYKTYIRTTGKMLIALLIIPVLLLMVTGIMLGLTIIIIAAVLLILTAVISYMFFKKYFEKPLVVIYDDYLILRIQGWKIKKTKINWADLKGFVREEINTSGLPVKRLNIPILRFVVKDDPEKYNLIVNLKIIENSGEIIGNIKERLPDLSSQYRKRLVSKLPDNITYKGYTITEKGLIKGMKNIPWENIKKVKPKGITIAGYKGIKIEYINSLQKVKKISISPKSTPEYLLFIKSIIGRAEDAEVDPILYNMLRMKPAQAKTDEGTALINILFIFSIFFLMATNLHERYMFDIKYGFLFIPAFICWIVSLLLNNKNVLVNYLDFSVVKKTFKMTIITILTFILTTVVFFLSSPGSLDYLQGDINLMLDNKQEAVFYYQKVLDIYSENVEILYTNAKTYYQLEEYKETYKLMEKAYNNFDGRWNPSAVKLIPLSLMKMQKYDKADKWCDKIIEDNKDKNKEDIYQVMNNIKKEIEDMR